MMLRPMLDILHGSAACTGSRAGPCSLCGNPKYKMLQRTQRSKTRPHSQS